MEKDKKVIKIVGQTGAGKSAFCSKLFVSAKYSTPSTNSMNMRQS